ncbi:MAG: glycosyltransferase [Methylococcaceae bacterium]
MQRIVWINKGIWLKPGPIGYMGLLNALAFAENDCATDFFVRAGDASDTEVDLRQFYGLHSHQQLNIQRIPDSPRGKRSVYFAAVEKISEYFASGDEVLALTRELGALVLLLKLKKKYPQLKVLHETHDYYLTTRHLGQKKFSISSIRRQWVEKRLIAKVDGLICLTEHQRALYQQWFPAIPMMALSLGCLGFLRQPDLNRRRLKRSIVYIGNLSNYKGIELTLELAEYLKSANIKLYSFGGNEDEVLSLQSRANQQGLKDVLYFKSFVNPKDLHEVLDTEISIGLVPLQDTFYNRYLTCPVKALDYTAHGLPVIASELPSIREVLRETGFYCNSRNVSEFADHAIRLLDSEDAYLSASQASYARSRELQWRFRAQSILNFAATL